MSDTEITVRADLDHLEWIVDRMQQANPDLTVDDCCNAIFSIGMLMYAGAIQKDRA